MAELEDRMKDAVDEWAVKMAQHATDIVNQTINYSGGQSSGLADSINTEVTVTGKGQVTFSLSMADYYKFIESGVDGYDTSHGSIYKFKKEGKPIPRDAMEHFIEMRHITFKKLRRKRLAEGKGLSLRKNKKDIKGNYEVTKKSLAFILGRSIKKHGINPRPFVDKLISPGLTKELTSSLANDLGQFFLADIKKI